MSQMTRRDFVKLGAVSAGALGATPLGFDLAEAVQVKRDLRIEGAKEVHSLCPYCAVGCSLIAFTKEDAKGHTKLHQIEGDPDSPVNGGTLCPKGASTLQLALNQNRALRPKVREAGATEWKDIEWDEALKRVARHMKDSRDKKLVLHDSAGLEVNRNEGFGFVGGATITSEEGYLTTKFFRALGCVYLEQQARV